MAAKRKVCGKCGKRRSVSQFYRNARAKDGLQGYCKACESVRFFNYSLGYRYGITRADYDAALIGQQGRCEVCSDPMEVPVVDHCHDSGAFRSLLCGGCNLGLGHFRDCPDRLKGAIAYLAA